MQRTWRVTPYLVLGIILCGLMPFVLPRFLRWLTDNGSVTRPEKSHGPAIVAEGAQSIVVKDETGHKAWEFAARRITISADKLYCTATDVQRGVLYRNGKPFLKLKARQVRLNQQTRDLEAKGRVSASGPDGFTVRSEQADWKHHAQRLTCPGDLKATLRGLTINTRAAYYDAQAGKLHCPQEVQVGSQRATLKGVNVVADTKTRTVQFNSGVQMAITPP